MPRKRKDEQTDTPVPVFSGFERPETNWFKMPNNWTDITAEISNIAELKVVEYILRHTWGYEEYDIKKHITIDEFVRGRRRRDGSRLDKGTGLSERAVRYGLQNAVKGGLVDEAVDDSDRGRTKKYYSLKMKSRTGDPDGTTLPRHDLQSGVQTLHPGVQELPPRGAANAPRTEKDTPERYLDTSNLRKAHAQNNRTKETSPPVTTAHPEHAHRPASQPEPIGTTLARRRLPVPVPTYDEDRQLILSYIEDFAREFGDRAPLKSSVSRALHLYRDAGVDRETFIAALYQARAITRERSAAIRTPTGTTLGAPAAKKKFAYFMAVLEDLLGRRPTARKKPES